MITEANEKNRIPLLSNEQLNFAVAAIVGSFDTELSRLATTNESAKVLNAFVNYYYRRDIHSFFVLQNITTLTQEVCEDTALRSFILNLSDRVSFLLSTQDANFKEGFVNTFIESIVINRPSPSGADSLINKEVVQTLYVSPEPLRKMVVNNLWLLIVYVLLMFFYQTQTFVALQTAQK